MNDNSDKKTENIGGPSIKGKTTISSGSGGLPNTSGPAKGLNISEPDEEEFTKGTFFVNLWKGLSWFLLMGMGIFICCMPWLAASFGLFLPTIFAGFTFPAMLALGLIIAIPSAVMVASSVLNILHQRGWAKFIKNVSFGAMVFAALVIGILLFAAPGLPVISAFAGMIGGLGSVGALLTKISLIVLGVCKALDVVLDCGAGSLLRAKYGAIGKGVHTDNSEAHFGIIGSLALNIAKAIRNLALIALAIVVCCKISLAFGLILAIPSVLKLVANAFDKHGNKRLHQVAKWLNNLVRGAFGSTLTFMGISLLKPTILVGFLGKLSIAAVFSGTVGLVAGISLIVFGALMLAKTVTDVICGDQEKFKQGVYEIATSPSDDTRKNLSKSLAKVIDAKGKTKDTINGMTPGLVAEQKPPQELQEESSKNNSSTTKVEDKNK